jgi:Ion channel
VEALGVITILVVFWDAFETLILPRRVSRRLRLARIFFGTTWNLWVRTSGMFRRPQRRENHLSFYGPLSLLFLVAVWGAGMILGFALLQLGGGRARPPGSGGFLTLLYMSASTFFTLGLGDVTPANSFARMITVVESGAGFTFLALVIAYLPVLYQAFSRREIRISMLDERAGSPPSAAELLGRRGSSYAETGVAFLRDWELWSAELLESHLSYPVLGYFRSQHDNQSWLAALTVLLDGCSLVITGIEGISDGQARLTFAMARNAAVDLASTLGTPPVAPSPDRLPTEDLEQLRHMLAGRGLILAAGDEADSVLSNLRASYEPYVNALSRHLRMPLPSWLAPAGAADNWEVTAWEVRSGRRARGDLEPPAPTGPAGEPRQAPKR